MENFNGYVDLVVSLPDRFYSFDLIPIITFFPWYFWTAVICGVLLLAMFEELKYYGKEKTDEETET